MPQKLSTKQLAAIAVENVVTAFRLSPPKEPDRVVRILDAVLGLTTDERSQLGDYKDVLFDLAEVQLEADFAENPESRQQFAEYFDTVFAEYVRSDRETRTLE